MRILTDSKKSKKWKCKRLNTSVSPSARQERTEGWNQNAMTLATGLLIGLGGGGEVAASMIRKGVGTLHICDPDNVTPSNLNRQLFRRENLYKNKAHELGRNLSREGVLGSTLISYPVAFQELDVIEINPDFIFSAVDNRISGTRVDICKLAYEENIPWVEMAVSTDADYGYVFIQEPGKACWACAFKPEFSSQDEEDICPNVPASNDILKALAGLATYAIDTLIMNRKRDWNYRAVSLSRSDFGGSFLVEKRANCAVCGNAK